MNEINREHAYTVTELASARQHQKNWPTIMERVWRVRYYSLHLVYRQQRPSIAFVVPPVRPTPPWRLVSLLAATRAPARTSLASLDVREEAVWNGKR